jgi:gamma-carbonic anhydrase
MKIRPYQGIAPKIAGGVFVAPDAVIIGDVEIGKNSSVWYHTVIRGDVGRARIGCGTNIQDLCMLHMTGGRGDLSVGDNVTVGHRAVLHGCRIEDNCLIGMGAIVMDDAVIGKGSVVAAGAVVLEKTIVPPGSLVAGVPAKILDTREGGERFTAEATALRYRHHAAEHAKLWDQSRDE